MTMYDYNFSGPWTFVAGAAIAANKLVKLDTAGKVIECAANDWPIGICFEAVASGAQATVFPSHGEAWVMAGGTFAIGDYVKQGATGQVIVETSNTTATVNTVGAALSAGTSGTLARIFFYM